MIVGNSTRKFGVRNFANSFLRRIGYSRETAKWQGIWDYRCMRPLQVTDPEKLTILVDLPVGAVNRLARTGTIADKAVRQIIARHQCNRPLLRELDRILFGGGLRWADGYHNLIVNEGLDHALDVVLSGGTQDTSWFVGLLAATPSPLAAWTATEIASNDFVAYDESTLQAFTDGGVSSQSLDNSASPATFTISTNSSSIGGAYLIGTNAKATPAGTVLSAGEFTGGNKAADDGDSLEVTVAYTAADA